MANSVDLDEVAHYEPPHQDLRCLKIQLFSSLVVKELIELAKAILVHSLILSFFLFFCQPLLPFPFTVPCRIVFANQPGRVAQSVGHLTRKSGVLGSIPGLATYFSFSFRFFKKGSCQLLAKVCARSTG